MRKFKEQSSTNLSTQQWIPAVNVNSLRFTGVSQTDSTKPVVSNQHELALGSYWIMIQSSNFETNRNRDLDPLEVFGCPVGVETKNP